MSNRYVVNRLGHINRLSYQAKKQAKDFKDKSKSSKGKRK